MPCRYEDRGVQKGHFNSGCFAFEASVGHPGGIYLVNSWIYGFELS